MQFNLAARRTRSFPHHDVLVLVVVTMGQIAIVVSYRDSLVLHTVAAILFFAGTTACIVVDYVVTARKPHACRKWIKCLLVVLVASSLVSMLAALTTFQNEPRIDRRPPLVAGEFLGIAAFFLHLLVGERMTQHLPTPPTTFDAFA